MPKDKTNQQVHTAILVQPVDSDAPWKMPERCHAGDAGFDLFVSRKVVVNPHAFAQIPTNIRMALPPGTWGMIIGRSSTFHRRLLYCNPSVIDNGWRGEMFALVYNMTSKPVIIQRGERLVQLVLFNLVTPAIQFSGEMPEGDRGEQGFGSTGGFTEES